MGHAIFRKRVPKSNEYVAEELDVHIAKLPSQEGLVNKSLDLHGIADSDCATGLPFGKTLECLLSVLEQSVQIVQPCP